MRSRSRFENYPWLFSLPRDPQPGRPFHDQNLAASTAANLNWLIHDAGLLLVFDAAGQGHSLEVYPTDRSPSKLGAVPAAHYAGGNFAYLTRCAVSDYMWMAAHRGEASTRRNRWTRWTD